MSPLRKLEGRRIVRADESPCRPHRKSDFNAPVLLLDDGTLVVVLADAEGNRPGHLKIVPPREADPAPDPIAALRDLVHVIEHGSPADEPLKRAKAIISEAS